MSSNEHGGGGRVQGMLERRDAPISGVRSKQVAVG